MVICTLKGVHFFRLLIEVRSSSKAKPVPSLVYNGFIEFIKKGLIFGLFDILIIAGVMPMMSCAFIISRIYFFTFLKVMVLS